MALVPGGGLPFGIKRIITGAAALKYLRRLLRLARSLRRGLRGVGGPSLPPPQERVHISVLLYLYSSFGFCELYSRHIGSSPTLAYSINIP